MPFPEPNKREALERAHYTCVVCRQPGVSLEVHHIQPQEEGGRDTIENACPLCPSCHADYGGNEEKRKMLTQMRDWWWGRCAKLDASPEVLGFNRQIAELRLDQARGFTELKELVLARERRTMEDILNAQTLEQLSAASGVSLPPQGTVFVFEPPPGAIEEDREIDRRILAAVESGDRSLTAIRKEFGAQRIAHRVERLNQLGLL